MKLNINKRNLLSLAMAGSISLGISGCTKMELTSSKDYMDILETNREEESFKEENEIVQKKEVNGEEFSLVIHYQSGSKEWRITDNKKLYIKIHTENLLTNFDNHIIEPRFFLLLFLLSCYLK